MYVCMYACMHACMYVCIYMYVCMYVFYVPAPREKSSNFGSSFICMGPPPPHTSLEISLNFGSSWPRGSTLSNQTWAKISHGTHMHYLHQCCTIVMMASWWHGNAFHIEGYFGSQRSLPQRASKIEFGVFFADILGKLLKNSPVANDLRCI